MKTFVLGVLVTIFMGMSTLSAYAAADNVEKIVSSYDKGDIVQYIKEYKVLLKDLQTALKELNKGKKSKYYESFKSQGGGSMINSVIQSQVNNMRAQAEIYGSKYDGSVSYTGLCTNSNIILMLTEANTKNLTGSTYCSSSANAWMIAVDLVAPQKDSRICVDSTGVSKITKQTISGSALTCPNK